MGQLQFVKIGAAHSQLCPAAAEGRAGDGQSHLVKVGTAIFHLA